jgi:hypothetical protein
MGFARNPKPLIPALPRLAANKRETANLVFLPKASRKNPFPPENIHNFFSDRGFDVQQPK